MQILLMTICLLCAAGYALRYGEQPERSVATLLLASSAIDFVYHALTTPPQFETIDPVHVVIDTLVLAGLLAIALNANRGWPLWVCGAQIIMMLGHLGKLYEVRTVLRGYWVMTQVPFMIQLTLLVIGTAAHNARLRQVGPYHSWRLS